MRSLRGHAGDLPRVVEGGRADAIEVHERTVRLADKRRSKSVAFANQISRVIDAQDARLLESGTADRLVHARGVAHESLKEAAGAAGAEVPGDLACIVDVYGFGHECACRLKRC